MPSIVLVECLHGHPGRDALPNSFLKTCDIVEEISEPRCCRRLARQGSAVDALVVALAEPGGTVLTSDPGDLGALTQYARDVIVKKADLGECKWGPVRPAWAVEEELEEGPGVPQPARGDDRAAGVYAARGRGGEREAVRRGIAWKISILNPPYQISPRRAAGVSPRRRRRDRNEDEEIKLPQGGRDRDREGGTQLPPQSSQA